MVLSSAAALLDNVLSSLVALGRNWPKSEMEYYEELIHFYLTAVKQFLVLPQAAVLHNSEGKPWEAYVDFVALDFKSPKICLIEVTSDAKDPQSALKRLDTQNHAHIENYVRKQLLQDLLPFPMVWWLFVRRRLISKIEKDSVYTAYRDSGGLCEIIAIQKVLEEIGLKLS